jgi:hypothetical protein
MTQTQYFKWLGAPLVNPRWSWGSVRSDETVFLRVWQDETLKHEDKRYYMRVTKHEAFAQDQDNLGYQERLKHIELVRKGAKCYLVMCEANPEKLPEREIKDFNANEVFLAGTLIELNGDFWLEYTSRIPSRTIRA